MSVYDTYPASELSETIVVFTEDGIDNLQRIINVRREMGDAPPKPAATIKRREP
ncbi:hypothetical protein [Rhizobium gallicum]|uniref:hypothetical protein n=1 Tax=Rhizobium gallicum TaxID=56730 RepID=UPI001EF7E073|nr:hypothetical protein [Rhizobium gallicum]ULJ72362.1 hypothetical protein L2W42_01085 [Rhizobium gallicum]